MHPFLRRNSILIVGIVLWLVSVQLVVERSINESVDSYRLAIRQFITGAVAAVSTPFFRAYTTVLNKGDELWTYSVRLLHVQEEREKLLEQLKALERRNAELVELERENERLRKLLNFKEEAPLREVPARVVARNPSNWIESITIDRGRRDGVLPGQAVVDGLAVVGHTTEVTENSARVLLITDATSGVGALLQDSRVHGIVEGSSNRDTLILRLRYVVGEEQVQPGMRVVTSGLDGVFPKGVTVGVVTMVAERSQGMFRTIEVAPSAEIARLEDVLVLVPTPAATGAEASGS